MGEETEGQKRTLDFNALFFDAEVLVRSNWPDPSVLLTNVLTLANSLGLGLFVPEPVEWQTEQNWLRRVRQCLTSLSGAAKDFTRHTRSGDGRIQLEHDDVEGLRGRYHSKLEATK